MSTVRFFVAPAFRSAVAYPVDRIEPLDVKTLVISSTGEVFGWMRRAEALLHRENMQPERFLLGATSYLEIIAAVRQREMDRQWSAGHLPVDFGNNEEPRVFGLPCSLDPSKPPEWVQCLPETRIRNATIQHLPPNLGVSRGEAASNKEAIRSVIERATERRIILPEEECSAIAKVAVVTSYWDQPMPRKKDFEWNGVNR